MTKSTTVQNSEPTEVKIAVMNNDIKHIIESQLRIEGKFDAAIKSFATQQQLAEVVSTRSAKFAEYDKSLAMLFQEVGDLQKVDERQQGTIEAKKSISATLLTVMAALAGLIGGLIEALIVHGALK